MPDSGTSSQSTFNIPENTLGINAIRLNEENPWEPPNTGKLISPPGTPNTESQTSKREELEDLLRNQTLPDRFGPDRGENLFNKLLSERIPILPTFSTWESTDDTYYYNLLKKKREPAKRKIIFGQTITTPPSNLLSGKQPRYQTRY